jgi:hypothetical protein
MNTLILDPEATKVCKPSGSLPVRYSQYPASTEVLQQADFCISAEQLISFDLEIERRSASGEDPALVIGSLARQC